MILACYREFGIGQLVQGNIWIDEYQFLRPFMVIRESNLEEWQAFWIEEIGHIPNRFPECNSFYKVSVD